MKYRDRIKSLRRVKAGDLLPSPANWREHTEKQINAMRGVLSEVGWADAALARETPDGLMLIDGHLRADLDPEEKIPVLVLAVDEDEANKIMATHDPIAAMANADAEKLGSLIDGIETQNDAITEMLDALAKETGARLPEFEPVDEASQGRLDQKAKAICPHCGGEFTIK